MNAPGSAYNQLIADQLRKATNDLRNLQQLLTLEGIDPRILLDFREAVDAVRHVAWAVQQYLDTKDADSLTAILTAYRVKIATQLCTELTLSIGSGELTSVTPGADRLRDRAADLSNGLAPQTITPV